MRPIKHLETQIEVRSDIKAHTGEYVIPENQLFPFLLRHCAWCITRFLPHGPRGVTGFELRTGTVYKSPIVPFCKIVMIRVPIDPPGLRKKMDAQWLKSCWVGRADESDSHMVLHEEGMAVGKSVRRLAPELRVQPKMMKKFRAKISDPILRQAKLIRLLPLAAPVRLEGESELVPPSRVEVNTEATATVEPRSTIDVEAGAEELGVTQATIDWLEDVTMNYTVVDLSAGPSRPRREREDDGEDEPPSRRTRVAAFRISSIDQLAKTPERSEASIIQSRAEHVRHLIDSEAVEDWPEEKARATGARLLTGRFVDDPIKGEVEILRERVRNRKGSVGFLSSIGRIS